MKNIELSPGQFADGLGLFQESAESQGLVLPSHNDLVTYNGKEVVADLGSRGVQIRQGMATVGPTQAGLLHKYPGLKSVVAFRLSDGTSLQGPAIVLAGGTSVGVLTAEGQSEGQHKGFTALQHGLLDAIYDTQRPDVVAHGAGERVQPTAGGHGLVAASFTGSPIKAHDSVHDLADKNFGTTFDSQGFRDIRIGHDTRAVRSAVLPLSQVIFATGEGHNTPGGLFAGAGSASELNLGLTVADTLSRTAGKLAIASNLEAMSARA